MGKSKGAAVAASGTFKKGVASKTEAKVNPFEQKVNKPKFSVLNRQVVGTKGRPSQSRARSHELRKKSLAPELARRGRTSEFIDRRFGERNREISSEEKMLERFSRERIRSSKKKSVFNLQEPVDTQDDYSHTLTLTHRGKNIDDLDDFDSDPDISDVESDGGLDRHVVRTGHFGGGNFDGDEKRTKAEIMQEVIAKSKMHKHERQRIKEENANLCDDLDADFKSLRGALEPRDYERDREVSQNSLAKDDYDEAMRMMTFDRRAQPTDRTKTELELVEEMTKKREKVLKEKHQRMQADSLDGDASSDEEASTLTPQEIETEKSLRKVMDQVEQHLDQILDTESLNDANSAFNELVALARTRSVIPVARIIRERLSNLTSHILRLQKKGSGPTMPDQKVLLLFHLIGRIFSTSDFHHIVATPAQLLIAAYLETGRITKKRHLLSALFLMQTILYCQRDSRRYSPEMISLLAPLLFKTFSVMPAVWSPYPHHRFMSKSVNAFLSTEMSQLGELRGITFDDLAQAEEDEDYLTKEMFAGMLVKLLQDSVQLYEALIAAPEIFLPLLNVVQQATLISDISTVLKSKVENRHAHRAPLMMQKFKPIAIPQLTPDLGDVQSREEKEQKMLKQSYKRELKGAKRELKRDSAFLARHKLEAKLVADQKYQERMRQIMGSISNEGNKQEESPKKRKY